MKAKRHARGDRRADRAPLPRSPGAGAHAAARRRRAASASTICEMDAGHAARGRRAVGPGHDREPVRDHRLRRLQAGVPRAVRLRGARHRLRASPSRPTCRSSSADVERVASAGPPRGRARGEGRPCERRRPRRSELVRGAALRSRLTVKSVSPSSALATPSNPIRGVRLYRMPRPHGGEERTGRDRVDAIGLHIGAAVLLGRVFHDVTDRAAAERERRHRLEPSVPEQLRSPWRIPPARS